MELEALSNTSYYHPILDKNILLQNRINQNLDSSRCK